MVSSPLLKSTPLTHSRHTSVCFLAVTWDKLQSGPQSDSEHQEVEAPPPGTTIGDTYYPEDELPDLDTNDLSYNRAFRPAAGPETRLLPF